MGHDQFFGRMNRAIDPLFDDFYVDEQFASKLIVRRAIGRCAKNGQRRDADDRHDRHRKQQLNQRKCRFEFDRFGFERSGQVVIPIVMFMQAAGGQMIQGSTAVRCRLKR